MLSISRHERVPGHSGRWHVHLHGHAQPLPVELAEEERRSLDLTDEEVHALLPTALQRRAEQNPDEPPLDEEYRDATWDAPVRVMQTHFIA